ncbi:MAG: thioether cross-link-forming SCIFF peptide maturase, partial [Clostridia bacterium]|nr:thioether cross-link-forming SCIFF peptide maturase [Clostridia bacterium]
MVHVFKYKSYNYIYDSGSGSLHECDDKTYAYLAYNLGQAEKPDLTADEISGIEWDIAALKEQGLLFKEETAARPAKSNEVKALCIHICHDCNLRCRYCFADEGAYHSERE